MKYALWHSRDGNSDIYTLLAVDETHDGAKNAALEPGAKIIRTFEADTWEKARRQQHEYLGWEPYKPIEDRS